MKRLCLIALIFMFWACNDSNGVSVKVDSLSKKIDSGAERIWDSTKEGAKRLKEKIDDKFDGKDSTKK
jgi:hypothetical protein